MKLQLCLSDSEVSSITTVQAFIAPSVPYFESSPDSEIIVEEGSIIQITVQAVSVPPPRYQWQYLTYSNSTPIPDDNSTLVTRNFDEWHDPQVSFHHLRHMPYIEERDDLIEVRQRPNQPSNCLL